VGLELLKAAARQRLTAKQGELDLGLDAGAACGPLPVGAWRMSRLDARQRGRLVRTATGRIAAAFGPWTSALLRGTSSLRC
jgi:hypothetical protein